MTAAGDRGTDDVMIRPAWDFACTPLSNSGTPPTVCSKLK